MSVLASIRNNFLGIVFLSLLLLPTVARADYDVPGDITKNINNYSGGSYFARSFSGSVGEATGANSGSNNKTLFSSVQTIGKLTDADVDGLQFKLEKGGSSLNPDAITKDNTYRVNTENASLFYYRNPADGKDYLVAEAFKPDAQKKTAELYVFKQPLEKNSGSKDSLDTSTESGALNSIDQSKGLPLRTTINAKNLQYDLTQEKLNLDSQLVKANADLDAAQKARDNYTGSDAATIRAYDKAIEEARAVRDGAEAKQKSASTTLDNVIRSKSATQPQQELGCGITNFYKIDCILYFISVPANIGFKLVSFFTYVIGTLFDYSLELSINSAELIKKLGVVEITWSFIRDVLNMSFIFILLGVAIQILLDSKDNYNARKVLTRVILVAIGINFSLFGAKLMVDGSNIVSLKIYESMKATSASGEISSISERVMNTVGLTTLYSFSDIFSTETVKSCSTVPAAIITISVMGSIFLLIICLALGLAAILFLIRMVNIIFLFIKSPFWVWGYVLPGNKRIEKFKDDWWKEMMHVLTFPIMYLFWMLVALIIFEKLGNVKNQLSGSATEGAEGPSLLDLICQPSTGGDITTTISLVAIFAIVIIFLMKAVSYGIKNATSGAEGSFGADLAAAAGKKVGGYQTMLTKGLRDKALGAAKTVSVGASKVPLRTITGLTGAAVSGVRGRGIWNGAKDGFLNPSINTKEALRDMARSQVVNGGIVGEVLGINKAAAKLSAKLNDPKNSAEETRKQVDERRVAKAKADEEARYDAIDKTFKALTLDEWKKKNPTKSIDDQKKYLENLMKKRTDALLGRGIVDKIDEKRDSNGDEQSHFDVMKANAIREIKDASGVVTGYKLVESAMHDSIAGIIKYRSGDGAGVGSGAIDKKRDVLLRSSRAAARLKAVSTKTGTSKKDVYSKDNLDNKTKSLEDAIKAIEDLPEEADITPLVTDATGPKIYRGRGDNAKQIRSLNSAIIDYNLEAGLGRNPAKMASLKKKYEAEHNKYIEHVKKQKEALVKKKTEYASHLKKIEEADAKK